MRVNLYTPDIVTSKAEEVLGEKVIECDRVISGMTNFNYRILTENTGYIYRVPGNASDLLVNRSEEEDILKLIQKIDIDVNTVYYDTPSGERITRLINDRFCRISSNRKKAVVACGLLKQLHTSGIKFKNNFCPIQKINFYESLMNSFQIPFYPNYSSTQRQLKILDDYLEENFEKRIVPCHNDPVPQNILLDRLGKPYLIDWEYAGMNEYLWDLAAFSLENNFDQKLEQHFLLLYHEEKIDPSVKEKMLIYKIYQDVLWSLWALIKSNFGTDFSLYGSDRYERAVMGLKVFHHLF